ncbi:MAG: PAS domain-containing protein [Dehalococcoidia bacterium]
MSELLHPHHDGCCLTAAFDRVMYASSVPVLVVDEEGLIVYVNPQLEGLMDYPSGELAGMHITEIVDAAPGWVATEFSYLADNRLWSGNVLLRRLRGGNFRVSVNAFRSVTPSSTAEYVALLHGIDGDGPAICRNPQAGAQHALTVEETALLELMSEGFIEKEIAAILGWSVWAVSREQHRLLAKLDASSCTEAGIRALQEGLFA